MALLLNPRVWFAIALAAILAFTHLFSYRAGKANVRADFDQYRIVQAQLAEKASLAARAKEQEWQENFAKAQDEAAEREKNLRTAAAGARTERDKLRNAIASATGGLLPGDSTATVLARAAAIGGLLNQCTERYQRVAEQADGHAADAVRLQKSWPK